MPERTSAHQPAGGSPLAGRSRSAHPVEIVEVSPRDGLQNEREPVSTADKLRLVDDLVAAGVRRMEVASFVRPERVPQMADAEDVMAGITRDPGVSYIGLVLNHRGAVRAAATGVDEMNYVLPATDTFGQRNQGVTVEQGLETLATVRDVAREHRIGLSVTISVSFGCPYEGEVARERVVDLARRALEADIDELALADTIGSAVPTDITNKVGAVRAISPVPLRLHLHETRHTGLANALAGLDAGVTVLDASAGGLGGCPFAPGAAGNVATEDLAWMLHRSGYTTGLDLDGIVEAGRRICGVLGFDPRSGVAAAGAFPASVGSRSV